VKLTSRGGKGPNCHIGSPAESPEGTVTCAVKVAVNGAGPEIADDSMTTEQCGTEDGIEFAEGCELIDTTTAMTTTTTTSATTARKTMFDVLGGNSSGVGTVEESPGSSSSTGREGSGEVGEGTSVLAPQYSHTTNLPTPGGGSGAPH